MRSLASGLLALVSLVTAQSSTSSDVLTSSSSQSSTTLSSTTSASLASSSSTSTSVTAIATSNPTAVTVATDGSAEFTAINAAISAAQNRGIASVSVKAGTYSESIVIQGTQTVTIAGPTASNYADNKVVISASATNGVVSFNTQKSSGAVFRNLNIVNTLTTSASVKAPAFYAYGSNILLDTVSLISGGTGVYQAGLGTTMISNSYIEGMID